MKEICDFCNSKNVVKSYPCKDFAVDTIMMRESDGKMGTLETDSIGGWAACQICANLINHDKWEELAVRAFETSRQADLTGKRKDMLMAFIRTLHGEFRRLRILEN